MKELKIEKLNHSYGIKQLFHQIDFSIIENQKIGIIGVNGTGKTSFLNILAGEIEPDSGEISMPGEYRIGYLKQKQELDLDKTVLDTIFDGDTPLMNCVRVYETILQKLSEDPLNEKVQEQFTKAEQQMTIEDAWNASSSAKAILNKLGIEDTGKIVGDLSGGQQKRVALAQVLIQEPDLLILDEPTNHLDFEMIKWLETFLSNYKGALLLVTHDRYFLDQVVNRIVELSKGTLEEYTGNYQEYVKQKAEREEKEAQAAHKKKQLYKQELAWMRAGVKARGTKQQARINRFEELKDTVHQSSGEESVNMQLSGSRLGKKVLELEAASFKRNEQVILDDFHLIIQKNDRIGITGENGSGKTTFLNILANRTPLDTGILTIGETVKIAYYTQTNEELDLDKRVINYLREIAEEVKLADGTQMSVAQLLEQFLFNRQMHGSKIASLSGGEKRRLYLLKLLMEQPNVLILDEPTNDLDIQTLTVLEEYISQFSGAVIAVSHDRYFLDKIAEKLLLFKGNGHIDEYYGKMTHYLEEQEQQQKEISANKKLKNPVPSKKQKKVKEKTKLTYMEEKEWATIEEEIFELETELEEIKEEMIKAGSDYTQISELNQKQTEIEEALEQKMNRWEYLSEYV